MADVMKVDEGWLLLNEGETMDKPHFKEDELLYYTEMKYKLELDLARYHIEVMRGKMSSEIFGEMIQAALQAVKVVRKKCGLHDD